MHSLVVTVRGVVSIAYIIRLQLTLQVRITDVCSRRTLQVQLQLPDVLQVQLQEIDYSAITLLVVAL